MNGKRNERGFTLIELLIVVAIIGILASTALATFPFMRRRAQNAQALSDLKNAITAQEAVYADSNTFIPCTDRDDCVDTLPGFISSGPLISISFTAPTPDTYVGTAVHSSGTIQYQYDNTVGEIEKLPCRRS